MKRKRNVDLPGLEPEDHSSSYTTQALPTTPSKSALSSPVKQRDNANNNNKRVTFGNGLLDVPLLPAPVTPQKGHRSLSTTSSPTKDDIISDPPIVLNANRSARRKSARNLIERTVRGDVSDDEDEEAEEDELALRILRDKDGEGSDGDSSSENEADEEVVPATPSKRGRGGRQKKEKEKEVQAPVSIEGFSSFFEQNHTRAKTSSSTLSSLPSLTPETYFRLLATYKNQHEEDIEHLCSLHQQNFPQWSFELSQGFNVMSYGYGSKRSLIMDYVKQEATSDNPVVIINGFIPSITIREILNTVTNAALGSDHGQKMGTQPNDVLDNLLPILDSLQAKATTTITNGKAKVGKLNDHIMLVIHSIDSPSLRSPQTQAILSRLVSHPFIRLVASIDHILAPLLWDSSTLTLYNFVFHDATTFAPFTLETSNVDESDSILDVLTGGNFGRAGRSGARGVKYVLASLPGNAKGLYRILVANQLQAMEEDGVESDKMGGEEYGLEFKNLYQKAVEEFLCSSDMAFRTLLNEYVVNSLPLPSPPSPSYFIFIFTFLSCPI